ncbi:MAG TPA: cytochrome c peroxidase [Methylomirabilota bacterium]|nr:cytochrome c peroxidase [Methylomirabilota bacterium]
MCTTHARALIVLGWLGAILGAGDAAGQVPPLSSVAVPRPPNLGEFLRDEQAARVLGKALFSDMQVGSDGVQACASCHFLAGADPRKKNQISPGLLRVVFRRDAAGNTVVVPNPDLEFDGQGPNDTLRESDFPFRRLADPTDRESTILADTNNVTSSQGVHHAIYGATGRPHPDPENFRVGQGSRAANVRRVEPRNTPTMINAVFNHRNFWDLRAEHVFNGVNPFGERDTGAFLYGVEGTGNLAKVQVRLPNSSLASQAVGPPTNRFEMSADGRPFPIVGRNLTLEIGRRHRALARRLRSVVPLGGQLVRPDDSLLGPYSRWPRRGLTVDYENLIRQAFQPRWWASNKLVHVAEDGTTTVVSRPDGNPLTGEYTLVEYNFSLFFGLAVQAYESTLVSDDTPFDRFLGDPVNAPLSAAAERGRQIFFSLNPAPAPRGNCLFCHSGSLLSEASVDSVAARGMIRTSGGQLSDTGTRNIGVRETTEDLGNGGLDPFGASLSVAVRDSPAGSILAADGTFKIPGLRNVALTAPYFHNGGEATLLDVIDFYARGGNQGGASNPIQTRDGVVIGGLSVLNFNTAADADAVKADLVAFLEALTDERVRRAAAPFDRPQLFVPNGHPGDDSFVAQQNGQAVDSFLEIPATGRQGGRVLPGFLDD